MNKENKSKLEGLLKKIANVWDFEICGLCLQTNQNPIVIEIIIKKTNGEDISLDDCALFNNPASEEIDNSTRIENFYFCDFYDLVWFGLICLRWRSRLFIWFWL